MSIQFHERQTETTQATLEFCTTKDKKGIYDLQKHANSSHIE